MWRFAVSAVALVLAGCSLATEYGPMGLTGGVESAPITDDTFRIVAQGNGYTDAATIQDYTLLKAAELTLAANETYFQIVNGADTTSNSVAQTPGYISTHIYGSSAFTTYTPGVSYNIIKPGDQVIVRVFTPKKGDVIPPNSFPAQEVYDNINPRVKRAS
jgi:hypothetical protein